MQIMIYIDDNIYKSVKNNGYIYEEEVEDVALSIIGGTLLPKGHGRLKDADAICKDVISALGIRDENYLLEAEKGVYKRIKNAPTIIEADKAEGE